MIKKIVSGGQTGVDRAALDYALHHKFPAGGWCPKGRKAEDGPIDAKYPLAETSTDHYEERSVRNVVDSDGSLIITPGSPSGGTAFTIEAAYELNKPFFLLNLTRGYDLQDVKKWITHTRIKTLNIAGPRESEYPGIYEQAKQVLEELF